MHAYDLATPQTLQLLADWSEVPRQSGVHGVVRTTNNPVGEQRGGDCAAHDDSRRVLGRRLVSQFEVEHHGG